MFSRKEKDEKEYVRYGLRITDLWFFGTIFSMLILIFVCIILNITIPGIFSFWWVILSPIILKAFVPKSKFVQWIEKERW